MLERSHNPLSRVSQRLMFYSKRYRFCAFPFRIRIPAKCEVAFSESPPSASG
jgi:hypothetical protein